MISEAHTRGWSNGRDRRPSELVERLPAHQVLAAQELLEEPLDPVSRAIFNAPFDDEPESETERLTVDEANKWMKLHPEGIPFEEVVADCGLTMEQIENYQLD
jgi:hypothetical protein